MFTAAARYLRASSWTAPAGHLSPVYAVLFGPSPFIATLAITGDRLLASNAVGGFSKHERIFVRVPGSKVLPIFVLDPIGTVVSRNRLVVAETDPTETTRGLGLYRLGSLR